MSALGQQKKRRRQVMLPSSVDKHNPKDKAAELSDGLRRIKKMRVVNLNQQIAEHTKHKDLGSAIAAFQRARELGVANDFTYTNLINCHVRCGDVPGATKLLKRMRREGLKPGVIAYTTVLKGHAGRGDLARVEHLLREMAASYPPIDPNVRTINTCLRGCGMVGAVAQVQPMLARMLASAVSPDGSTLEYAATLLCQGLRIDEARPLVAALAKDSDHVATASARLGLSRAALVLGQWSVARKEIKEFERSLDAIVQAEQAAEEAGRESDYGKDGSGDEDAEPSDGGGAGGRRGWRAEATRQRSAVAFNSHRIAEWRREVDALRKHLQYAADQSDEERRQLLAGHFRRVLFFRLPSESRPKSEASSISSADEVGTAVCERLGAAIALPELPVHTWIETASTYFDGADNLDFRAMFPPQKDTGAGVSKQRQSRRPVYLEVGSGGGEWACAQAAASADSVDWVTLELRSDRVYHTFLNCIFSNLTNLAMLGGDVHKVAAKIRPGSLGAIFVNHPEPPHQYDDGGGGDGVSRSDGEHMLTPQFFAAAYRSLEPGGRLTIVTDNQHYARLLLQSVTALSDGGKRYVSSASPLHRVARSTIESDVSLQPLLFASL
jgi:pentatricopeptide repeat protein